MFCLHICCMYCTYSINKIKIQKNTTLAGGPPPKGLLAGNMLPYQYHGCIKENWDGTLLTPMKDAHWVHTPKQSQQTSLQTISRLPVAEP